MHLHQKLFRILVSILQFRILKNKTQNLSGKIYLLTGAARRIGAELKRNLALQNAEVLCKFRIIFGVKPRL